MIVRSILRLKGLKMITDDTNRRIISQNTIVEQDEDYYCLRVKAGDKWDIIKLSHRMKKSDRPDYLKDDDDTMD